MSKKYLVAGIILFLITLAPVFGADRYLLWEKNYDGGLDDIAYSIAIDSKNNIIVCGTSQNIDNRTRDYYTIKYDTNGRVLWEKRYDIGIRDESYDVAVDSKDNIIVTGTAKGKYFIIKYDKNGNTIWTTSPSSGNDDASYGVAVDSKDNIIVTGRTKIVVYNFFTIKYDKNGKMLWDIMWTNGEDDVPHDVAVDSKDNIIVTGFSSNGENHKGRGDYTYYTFKYSKDGEKIWHGKWGTSHPYAEAYGVSIDSEDNIIVTGFVMNKNNHDFYTVKSDPNGKIIWEKLYDRSNYDRAYDVTVDSNNNIYVTGVSYTSGANYDFCTIKYDSNGILAWEKIHDKGRVDESYGITIDTNNNVIVTGGSTINNWDFLTIMYKNK